MSLLNQQPPEGITGHVKVSDRVEIHYLVGGISYVINGVVLRADAAGISVIRSDGLLERLYLSNASIQSISKPVKRGDFSWESLI